MNDLNEKGEGARSVSEVTNGRKAGEWRSERRQDLARGIKSKIIAYLIPGSLKRVATVIGLSVCTGVYF